MDIEFDDAIADFQEGIISHDADSNRSNGSNSFSLSVDEMVVSRNKRKGYINQKLKSKMLSNTNAETEIHGKQISEDKAIDIDLKSLSLKDAEDELENRPKNGAIYKKVSDSIFNTLYERLKFLSYNDEELSIDEAIEIYDATVLMKFMRIHDHEIQSVGQIAHNGVLLILQGQMLEKKGRQQLALSKSKLQEANLI